VSTRQVLRWPHPRLLAHRGGGALAPENTLSGLRLARRLGYAGVEFDVKLTADGVAILMHDDTLDRTTTGSGQVAFTGLARVSELDAGSWFARPFAGERVPTFREAAEVCRSLALWVNVEIKPCAGREVETGAAVARDALDLWAGDSHPPLLSSFSRAALAEAGRVAPGLARGLLVADVPEDWQAALSALGCAALHVEHGRVTPALAAAVHAAGVALLCYTVNDPARAAELLAFGVDCIVTDRLDLFEPD
jgi:glycerophosphoryl diester phosphodiesterase